MIPQKNLPVPQIFISFVLALVLFSCAHQKGNGKLVIGDSANLNHIVIPDETDEVTRFAATELQDYLGKITGSRLQIISSSSVKDDVAAIRMIHENNDKLKWDGFGIETDHQGILISAAESRGLLYGVYTLLEEAGCSFFYPGQEEEVVPRKVRVEFQPGSRVFNPVLEHRGLTPYGLKGSSVELGSVFIDWMAKNRMNFILVSEDRPSDCAGSAHASIWKEVSDELLPELQKRGFVIEMSEHCTHVFFPRSLFDQHPDWFALNDGERKLGEPPYSGQMCYSNPDAVEYYASAIADYASIHPEFHIIGTWPLDGGNYCECEGCKNPQTVFNAAKRVAEKVKKVRPDMIVEHLAYRPQTWQPPADEIPANMSVLWCPDIGAMEDLAGEWIQKSSMAGGVYQFEYYMGDNYRSRANVWLRPVFSANLVQNALEKGFRGVISLVVPMENWWRYSFNNWFFARACWDPAFDIDAGLHDYCQKYYGAQAAETEEVCAIIFSELHPEPYKEPYKEIGDESFMDQATGIQPTTSKILDRLNRIIENNNDPAIDERLVRLRTYVEFFRLYTEAFSSQKMEDLEKLLHYIEGHPDQDMVLMYPEYFHWRNLEMFHQ